MSDGIDKISQTLGRLEAEMTSGQRQRETIFNLIKDVNGTLGAIQQELAVLRTTDARQSLDLAAMQTDVAALKVTRTKAATALTMIAALGAGAYEGAGRVAAALAKAMGN